MSTQKQTVTDSGNAPSEHMNLQELRIARDGWEARALSAEAQGYELRKERDCAIELGNKIRVERNDLQKERDELLAALKQIRAMLTQEVQWGNLDGSPAFKIIQGDCAIARNACNAAIARAEGSK